MARGNNRAPIVKDDYDRDWFVETLGEAILRAQWKLHSFVLMSNHYHLLLETPKANLVDGMRWLQGTWTARFNARNRHVGHLFQGRYKAIPVEAANGYFLSLANYIHLNPARAGLVDLEKGNLASYRWSSFPAFLSRGKPDWLCRTGVLEELGCADDSRGRLAYRRHAARLLLEMARSDKPWEVDAQWKRIRRGWHYGSESFASALLDKLDGVMKRSKAASSYGGEEVGLSRERAARKKLDAWLARLRLRPTDLRTLPKASKEKIAMAFLLKTTTTMNNRWIADHLKSGHPANLPRLVRQARNATNKSPLGKLISMLQCES